MNPSPLAAGTGPPYPTPLACQVAEAERAAGAADVVNHRLYRAYGYHSPEALIATAMLTRGPLCQAAVRHPGR